MTATVTSLALHRLDVRRYGRQALLGAVALPLDVARQLAEDLAHVTQHGAQRVMPRNLRNRTPWRWVARFDGVRLDLSLNSTRYVLSHGQALDLTAALARVVADIEGAPRAQVRFT
jgi:hypothetical protein